MADTFTTHYNLTKPQIGGDPDTWGTLLNANFDTIDSQLYTASTYALPLTGGTLTGSLTISTGAQLILTAATPNDRYMYVETNGTARWRFGGNNTAESGSNSGSDFAITAFADAGTFLSTPISIQRSTGVATFSARPVFASNTPWDSGNLTPSNYALLNSGPIFTGSITFGNSNTSESDLFMKCNGKYQWYLSATTGNGFTINRFNPSTGAFAEQALLMPASGDFVFSRACDAPDFKATSDERLKEHIRPLRRGINELKRMLPREYTKDGREEIGFLAQEAQEVIPEAVTEGHDGYLRLSYGQVTALLARAILEIDARLGLAGL